MTASKVRMELAPYYYVELVVEGSTLVERRRWRAGDPLKLERTKCASKKAASELLERVVNHCRSKGWTTVGAAELALPDDARGMRGFEVTWAHALEGLKGRLPKAQFAMVRGFARANAASSVLWVDEPWAEVPYEDFAANAAVALAVFAEPVDCEGALRLAPFELLGDADPSDQPRTYVFLEEVRAEAVVVVPDATTILAGGLIVSAACFSAPDATTFVGCRLHADTVVSGLGDGWVSLLPRTKVRVKTLCDYMEGKHSARSVPFERAFARWADELDDASAWELFGEAMDRGESVCAE
ncbi:MAG: hypothetical protein AAF938_16405 [Myxococcota bacterium]